MSRETIIWAAKQRYPYIALNTSIEATKKIWELYDAVALETGYEAGPENRGYLQQVHVSDSEEKAERNARQFLWMQGEFTGLAHPVWANPSGYFSPQLAATSSNSRSGGRRTRAGGRPSSSRSPTAASSSARRKPSSRSCAACSRKPVRASTASGAMTARSNEDARTCIRLLGQEVMPAMREIGKELGLKDPFELNSPVHLRYSTDLKQMPQAAE